MDSVSARAFSGVTGGKRSSSRSKNLTAAAIGDEPSIVAVGDGITLVMVVCVSGPTFVDEGAGRRQRKNDETCVSNIH